MKSLGRPPLSWCYECNLAVLDSSYCPICGMKIKRLDFGMDIRPSFPYDRDIFRKAVEDLYGSGCYELLVPDDRVVLLGTCFSEDVNYKVICDGYILGNLSAKYGRWAFFPDQRAASMISGRVSRHIVKVTTRGKYKFLRQRGLLTKDILEADPDIQKSDLVFVADEQGALIGIGRASVDGRALVEDSERTVIRDMVKLRGSEGLLSPRGHTWEETMDLNGKYLDAVVKRSVDFVRTVIAKHKDIPYYVSLSGGKDSLATLLLVLKAGFKPTVMYADTHMDCGSSDLVKGIAKQYGLKIITFGLSEDVLVRNLERLGPPAVNFRWCCRVHQLAPFYILSQTDGDNILSFVGNRRYESVKRSSFGSEWINPSSPTQFCASPVYEWNALHVWMFLMREKAPYNKLYESGFDRIGCYLCPISPPTILLSHEWDDPVAISWKEAIDEFGRKKGMPQVWYDKMLWRTRSHAGEVPGVEPEVLAEIDEKQKIPRYRSKLIDGTFYFEVPFDPACVLPLLPIIGVKGRMEDGCLITEDLKVTPDGKANLLEGRQGNLPKMADDLFDLALMATKCLECTACTVACKRSAITFSDQNVYLDASKCDGCRECMAICPSIGYLHKRW